MFSHFTFVMTLNCRLVLSYYYYCCSTCFDKAITAEIKNKNQIKSTPVDSARISLEQKLKFVISLFVLCFQLALPVSLLCFAFENAFLFDECSRDRPTFSNWWKEKGRRFRCDDFHFWAAADCCSVISVTRRVLGGCTNWLTEDNFNCTVVKRQSNLGLRYNGTLLCNNCAAA